MVPRMLEIVRYKKGYVLEIKEKQHFFIFPFDNKGESNYTILLKYIYFYH